MDYYNLDVFSNSTLTELKRQLQGLNFPESKNALNFGKEFDDYLFYKKTPSKENTKMIISMYNRLNEFGVWKAFTKFDNYTFQKEHIVDDFYGLKFKAKLDFEVLNYRAGDIKTTSCTTPIQFSDIVDKYDYDRQAYVYMTIGNYDEFSIIGVQKKYNPNIFLHNIKKGDASYNRGKEKTEELIEVLKDMLGV